MKRENILFGVAGVAIAIAIIIVVASFLFPPQAAPAQNYTGPSTCADGTVYGQCSLDKPLYCDAGKLIPDCSFCGCAAGLACDASGGCITEIAAKEEEPEVPEPEPEEGPEEWCITSEEYGSTYRHITARVDLIHAGNYYRTSYRSIDWVYGDTPLLILATIGVPDEDDYYGTFTGTELQARVVCGNKVQYGETHSIRTPRESPNYSKYALWDNLTACGDDFVVEAKLTYTFDNKKYTYCPTYNLGIQPGSPDFTIGDFDATAFDYVNNSKFESKVTVEFEPSRTPSINGVWLLTEDGEELYKYSSSGSSGAGDIDFEEISCSGGDICTYNLTLTLSPSEDLVYRVCDKREGLYLIYSSYKDRDYAEGFILMPNRYFDEICDEF